MDADPPPPPVRLAWSMQTCIAAPSQWDAVTVDGRRLYLRYRHGRGRVELTDWTADTDRSVETVWDDHDDEGMLSLEEFCAKANLIPPKPAMIFERAYLSDH